jgi:hypothetical protein
MGAGNNMVEYIDLDNSFAQNLYEGNLSPIKTVETAVKGRRKEIHEAEALQPSFSIGLPPAAINLLEYYEVKNVEMPAEIKIQLRTHNFFLQFFSFTIHPRKDSKIDWIEFRTSMRSLGASQNPTAYEMFPFEIFEETTAGKIAALSLKLKFSIVEVAADDVLENLKGINPIPVIRSFGLFEHSPYWHLKPYKRYSLEGTRKLAMVIQVPKEANGFKIFQNLIVNISTQKGFGRYEISPPAQEKLAIITRIP